MHAKPQATPVQKTDLFSPPFRCFPNALTMHKFTQMLTPEAKYYYYYYYYYYAQINAVWIAVETTYFWVFVPLFSVKTRGVQKKE